MHCELRSCSEVGWQYPEWVEMLIDANGKEVVLSRREDVAGGRKESRAIWGGILFVLSLLVAVLSVYEIVAVTRLERDWVTNVALAAGAWSVGYIVVTLYIFGHPYLFTSAYLMALGAFHFGLILADATGLVDASSWSLGPNGLWLQRAGWYSVLALACIGLGFSLATISRQPAADDSTSSQTHRNRVLARLFWDGIGLLIASMLLFAYAWYSYGNLLQYSRADIYHGVGGADPRGLTVFLMFFPSAIAMIVIGARTRIQKLFAIGTALFGIMLLLLSGYRSAAMFPLLAAAIVWVKIGRRIPLLVACGMIAIVLLLIPAIGHLRATTTYGSINDQAVKDSLKASRVDKAFAEMGGTAGVLSYILKFVPATDQYRWGTTYLYALKDSIPNLSLTQAQSEREVGSSVFAASDADKISQLKPSLWITYRVAPERFQVGEGVGFSGVGEPYMNFGLGGVIAFFSLLGFALARFDYADLLARPALLTFGCGIFWCLLRTVRNDSLNFTKPAIFIIVTLLLWRLCTKPLAKFMR